MIQRVREYTAGVNDCVPLVYIVYLVVVVVVVVSLREYNYILGFKRIRKLSCDRVVSFLTLI